MHPPNGHPSWPPPSHTDILLRIESRLGGLETGQRLTLDAVQAAFRKTDQAHARITRVEEQVRHMNRSHAGPPPTAPRGLRRITGWLAEVVPPVREVIVALLVIAVALGLLAPERVPGLTAVAPAVKSSGP